MIKKQTKSQLLLTFRSFATAWGHPNTCNLRAYKAHTWNQCDGDLKV